MAETQPIWLQALCYTADELRDLAPVSREGVIESFGGSMLVATTGAANHSVTIAAGSAWVAADGTGVTGYYRVTNDASTTVQLAAGGGGNSRVDTIVATVRDSEAGGADDDWVLSALAGTPSASAALTDAGITASAAAVPVMTLVLGYVLVANADTLTTTISGANVLDARSNYQTSAVAPYVDLRASAVTSIAHNQATYVKVALATQTHLDRDFYTVASSVVTVKRAGLYDITARSGFASGSASSEFAISVNGLAFANRIGLFKPGVATVSAAMEGTVPSMSYAFAANDTIQIGAFQFQSSGSAALNTTADSRLLVRKVG